jgi:hypothetical protein
MNAVTEYFEDDGLVAVDVSPTNSNTKSPIQFRAPHKRVSTDARLDFRSSSPVEVPPGTTDISPTTEETLASSENLTTELLAEWEGYVTSVSDKSFEARLSGIFGDGVEGEIEEAVIPIAELSEANKPLFRVGALFRLCVSYEKSESGQIRRFTEMVFRRLPAYRQQDLDAAHKRAQERVNGFRLD